MKAVLSETPGPADLLKVAEIETPVVPDDGVLVRVRAASINPVDLFSLTPVQHFMRRVAARGKLQPEVSSHDFAGTVTAVGAAVTQFDVGDEVFGAHNGAFAEYVAVPESAGVVCKPAGSSLEEAAADMPKERSSSTWRRRDENRTHRIGTDLREDRRRGVPDRTDRRRLWRGLRARRARRHKRRSHHREQRCP